MLQSMAISRNQWPLFVFASVVDVVCTMTTGQNADVALHWALTFTSIILVSVHVRFWDVSSLRWKQDKTQSLCTQRQTIFGVADCPSWHALDLSLLIGQRQRQLGHGEDND